MRMKNRLLHLFMALVMLLTYLTVPTALADDTVTVTLNVTNTPVRAIAKVRRQINPRLQIDGILLTMVDSRTNNARMISNLIRDTYGDKIRVFNAEIPHSVRAAEISAEGKSIFLHDPGGKVAEAYRALTKEVMQLEAERSKHKSDPIR